MPRRDKKKKGKKRDPPDEPSVEDLIAALNIERGTAYENAEVLDN